MKDVCFRAARAGMTLQNHWRRCWAAASISHSMTIGQGWWEMQSNNVWRAPGSRTAASQQWTAAGIQSHSASESRHRT